MGHTIFIHNFSLLDCWLGSSSLRQKLTKRSFSFHALCISKTASVATIYTKFSVNSTEFAVFEAHSSRHSVSWWLRFFLTTSRWLTCHHVYALYNPTLSITNKNRSISVKLRRHYMM